MHVLISICLAFAILFGHTSAGLENLGAQGLSVKSTINGTSSCNITARATRTTSLQTIYTSETNSTSGPPQVLIADLTAVAKKSTGTANYFFEFAIEPDFNEFLCNTSIDSPHGTLTEVSVAHCQHNLNWTPTYNTTMPARLSFAWKHQPNGTVLILRSTNPASANHCPDFPHDACWAQALYWIPVDKIWRFNGVEEYVSLGSPLLQLNGIYCKSGMPECVLSEYIY